MDVVIFNNNIKIVVNLFTFLFRLFFVFLPFLEPLPQHVEVPRLGVESELQLPAYTMATATEDLSHICDLHCNSQQCWIPYPPAPSGNLLSTLSPLFTISLNFNLLMIPCLKHFLQMSSVFKKKKEKTTQSHTFSKAPPPVQLSLSFSSL